MKHGFALLILMCAGAVGSCTHQATAPPKPCDTCRVLICIEDLTEGVPAVVEILNSLGEPVATLYNGTPEAEMGFCYRFDCSHLADGTYYAHVQAGNSRQSVKLSVQH